MLEISESSWGQQEELDVKKKLRIGTHPSKVLFFFFFSLMEYSDAARREGKLFIEFEIFYELVKVNSVTWTSTLLYMHSCN